MVQGLVPSVAAAFPAERCATLSKLSESPWGEVRGPTLTTAHLDAIAAAGFDAVRLPVRFSTGGTVRIDPVRLPAAASMMRAPFQTNARKTGDCLDQAQPRPAQGLQCGADRVFLPSGQTRTRARALRRIERRTTTPNRYRGRHIT
jgi:hypothetical protein